MSDILVLQIMMLLLMAVGAVVKKLGIVSDAGQKSINDLVIYVVLPCNIVSSFLIDWNDETLKQFAMVLVISLGIQICSVLLGKALYSKRAFGHRVNLQYGLICSNAGFLGNPVAEGVFGGVGLAMASIFLIPLRIMMWSSGIAIYTNNANKKDAAKRVATHPCIIACVIGIILMLTQAELPAVIGNTLDTIAACNTGLSMMVIGMILAGAKLSELFDFEIIKYSIVRLILMPLALYGVCLPLNIPPLVTGVCVILTAMPAGATTSILASKYHADELFATRLVVGSTIISMVTIPVWSMILTAAL